MYQCMVYLVRDVTQRVMKLVFSSVRLLLIVLYYIKIAIK